MHDRKSKRQSGFTAVELIAALVLTGVLGVFVYSFMSSLVEGFFFTSENSVAAGELKPMLDYVTTRMSDMEEVTCYTQNTEIQFTDSHDQAVTVEFEGGNTLSINDWDILSNLSSPVLNMTTENSHVKIFALGFDFELANDFVETYSMEFSPRRYIPSSDISSCP